MELNRRPLEFTSICLIGLILSPTFIIISPIGITENDAYGSIPLLISQTPDQPALINLAGEEISTLELGQQAIIRVTLHNHQLTKESFVVLVEVRDGTGVTEFLGWQSGTLEANADTTIGITWAPREMCGYFEGCESREIRSFVLSSLTSPQVLSPVYVKSGITVTGSDPKTPFIEHQYALLVDGQLYEIGYSFSEGDGSLISVDVNEESRTIYFTLVTPKNSKFTVMLPSGLFNSVFVGNTQEPVGLYSLVEGVETPFEQIVDFDKPTVTFVVPVQEGIDEIELGSKVGFESQFLGYYGSQIISLDMASVERNETESLNQIDIIAKSFNSCELRLIYIGYGLGSMNVAVRGLDWREQCGLAITYDIEMGREKLECSVPMQAMRNWTSWRNTDAPGVEEISDYCQSVMA